MHRFWLVLGVAALVSACQTTTLDLHAKTGAPAHASACVRMADRRSDCEDQIGCFWDYDVGTCAASH